MRQGVRRSEVIPHRKVHLTKNGSHGSFYFDALTLDL